MTQRKVQCQSSNPYVSENQTIAAQVRVEDSEDNLYASIDLVCDKIARKMRQLKDRAIATGKWPGRGHGNQSEADFADQVFSTLAACLTESRSDFAPASAFKLCRCLMAKQSAASIACWQMPLKGYRCSSCACQCLLSALLFLYGVSCSSMNFFRNAYPGTDLDLVGHTDVSIFAWPASLSSKDMHA